MATTHETSVMPLTLPYSESQDRVLDQGFLPGGRGSPGRRQPNLEVCGRHVEEVGCGWNTCFPSGLVYSAPCDLSKSPCPWEPALLPPRLQTSLQNFNGVSSVGAFLPHQLIDWRVSKWFITEDIDVCHVPVGHCVVTRTSYRGRDTRVSLPLVCR